MNVTKTQSPERKSAMTILLFHGLREHAGTGMVVLDASSPWSSNQLWEAMEARYPGISRFASSTRIARNQEYLAPDGLLFPGDEIGLIPPVSGG